jgi:tyrosine-protein phosphatase YwqE
MLFNFLSSKNIDFSSLGTDLHNHILPGIDDGAPDTERSIKLIRALQALGFNSFIATPHIYKGLYPNNESTINHSLVVLKDALKEEKMDVPILAAAEYMIDESFNQMLDSNNLLTLPGNRILVEMSPLREPPFLDEMLFKLQLKDYNPIIAHPERYLFVGKSKHHFHDWFEKGFELQLNLLSIIGYYGPVVQENATYLLSKKLVHFMGTDLHNEAQAVQLQKVTKSKVFLNLCSKIDWQNKYLSADLLK